jgi:hypothetical protein
MTNEPERKGAQAPGSDALERKTVGHAPPVGSRALAAGKILAVGRLQGSAAGTVRARRLMKRGGM